MKFICFDIDHTVSTFPHEKAMPYLRQHLVEEIGFDTGKSVADFVDRCYGEFLKRARGLSYDRTIEQSLEGYMSSIQKPERTSDLRWSRELWVYAAMQWYLETNDPISPQIAIEAAGAYWRGLAAHSHLYEDVEQFFDSPWWKNNQWQLVLVTSSDAYLRAEGNKFIYDPEYSDQKKRERIPARLLAESGNNIFVGDPISKPHLDFWNPVFANIGYEQKSMTNGHGTDIIVMVGDSYGSDIEGVTSWGGIPFLIDREYKFGLENMPEAAGIIHSFAELPAILEKLEKEKL